MNEVQNNAKLAYEYTKSIWETTSSSYDIVTTKLTTALGFSGLLLRFAVDLSHESWLIYIKIGVCLILSAAILCCCIGLYPRSSGKNLVSPDDFLEDETGDIYGLTEEESYLYIARGLSTAIKVLDANRAFRVGFLTAVIYCLGIASLGFALSITSEAMMTPDVDANLDYLIKVLSGII